MGGVAQLEVGSVFAQQFRVLRPLAQGGMGALYVVEQLGTGRLRALKIMQPSLAGDARGRDRFAQEAQVGSRIESEHVVEVIGAGVDDATGTPWLAMELLEGETLADAVARRGPFAPADLIEVYRQLCHALAAAHRARIVHRDLKPENIFLARARRSDARFVVKVLDFGIATWIQDNRAAATATSAIGSPFWMAPEQFEQRGKISPAADVWALGLIMFFLATGRQYWNAASADPFSLPALISEILVASMEPASQRAQALGVASPTLGPGFDAWFARCVNRDVGARPGDAAALLDALPAAIAALGGARETPYALPSEGALPSGASGTERMEAVPVAPPPDTLVAAPPKVLTQPMRTAVVTPPPVVAPATTTARTTWLRRVVAGVIFALALVVIAGVWRRTPPSPRVGAAAVCLPGQHVSDGHCCASGERWIAQRGGCVCVDAAHCGVASAIPLTDASAQRTTVVERDVGASAGDDAQTAPAQGATTGEGLCVGRWHGVSADRELRLTVRLSIERTSGPECGRMHSTLEYLISPLPPSRSVQRLIDCAADGDRIIAVEQNGAQRTRAVLRCSQGRATYTAGAAPIRLTRR